MRSCVAAFVAILLLDACARLPAAGARVEPIMVARPDGLTAVSAVGARSVKLLLVRPPSIVLLREVFVPEGETVVRVGWSRTAAALIVETDVARFALDPRTGRLAQPGPFAAPVVASRGARTAR